MHAPTLPTNDELTAALDGLDQWAHQCHGASLKLVRSGLLPGARVARGSCAGVGGQHSWVVVGDDCYAADAVIVDPTLWSYDRTVVGIWRGTARDGRHHPHGSDGDIWTWGRPSPATGTPIELTPAQPLSAEARRFVRLLGPLDKRGWMLLASSAPVRGWPAGELLSAMDDTRELTALVPIDRLGMLTDRNPNGLYR